MKRSFETKNRAEMTQWEKAENLVMSNSSNSGVFFLLANLNLFPNQKETIQESSTWKQTKLVRVIGADLVGSTSIVQNKLLKTTVLSST
jgi:hypothetical protein